MNEMLGKANIAVSWSVQRRFFSSTSHTA